MSSNDGMGHQDFSKSAADMPMQSLSSRLRKTQTDGIVRKRYVVGAYKIEAQRRDIAHRIMNVDNNWRDFRSIMHADDDDAVQLGTPVAYVVYLSDEEAEEFRQASNCRYVEEDRIGYVGGVDDPDVPAQFALDYMSITPADEVTWHGKNVNIAILDTGTSAELKARFGWTVVAHYNFLTDTSDTPDAWNTQHGAWVTSEAVPKNGRLIQAITNDTNGSFMYSTFTEAVIWAVGQGAKVINFSSYGTSEGAIMLDGLAYAANAGVPVTICAGNDSATVIGYPARYSGLYGDAAKSGASVDLITDALVPSSNSESIVSGAQHGDGSQSVGQNAATVTWFGTSAVAPKMARMIAMGLTSGEYTSMEVADALEYWARKSPAHTFAQMGNAGIWDFNRAMMALKSETKPWSPSAAVLSTTFAGVDGAAWPAPWAFREGAGTATIQANRGRQVSASNNWSRRDTAPVNLKNFRLTAKVSFPVLANACAWIDFRVDPSYFTYRLLLAPAASIVRVAKFPAVVTIPATRDAAFTFAANTQYNIIIEAYETTIRVKIWESSEPEPVRWMYDMRDPDVMSPGDVVFAVGGWSTMAAIAVDWDDVIISPLVPNKLPVTGLAATAVDSTRIDLRWDPVIRSTGYDIERDGSVIITSHQGTSYSDTGLVPGTHNYRVRARKVN